MKLTEIVRNFVCGAIPGMIAHEETQEEVFERMTREIKAGQKRDNHITSSDDSLYTFGSLMYCGPDIITYLIAAGWTCSFISDKEYGSAALVALGASAIRGYFYSNSRARSEEARQSVALALDEKGIIPKNPNCSE